VNLPLFELELPRVGNPEVMISHRVILFDSIQCCEHLAVGNLRLESKDGFIGGLVRDALECRGLIRSVSI
jgi:hypothetical protein